LAGLIRGLRGRRIGWRYPHHNRARGQVVQVTLKHWAIAVLWPSFALAAVATGLFFSTFDPQQLMPFDRPVALNRLAAYSIGFLAFWLYSALSIAVGLYFVLLNTQSETRTAARHEDE
jgi:hypothetical protein